MHPLQTQFRLPGRTVHNLSHVVKFDARAGVIYPLTHIPMLPVDRVEAELRSLVLTFPTKSPLMSNFQARIYAFFIPYRLYVPNLRANARLQPQISETINSDTGAVGSVTNTVLYADNWTNVQLPAYTPNLALGDVKHHCLWEFLGLPVGFRPADITASSDSQLNYSGKLCALRLLAYYDIFRNYFMNSMEDSYPVYTSGGTLASPSTLWAFKDVSQLDIFFRTQAWIGGNGTSSEVNRTNTPWYSIWDDGIYAPYSGMLVKTFNKDMNNVFLSDSYYSNAIATSIVDVSSGNLNLNQLGVAERLYEYFSKVAATGGRFDEFARAEWGVDIRDKLDIPIYLKSWSFDIGFDTVVSNASTDSRELGALAGRGIGGMRKRGKRDRSTSLNYSTNEYGELVFYMTIEPKNDYYQGIDPFLCKTYLGDLHTPSLDRLGWQPLFLAQLNALSTAERNDSAVGWTGGNNPFGVVVGHQPAWTEYKSMTNRLHGNLAVQGNTLQNWVLSRDYESSSFGDSAPDRYISYIDPASYNDAFADTSTSADPFVVQVVFDVVAKRPVSNANIHVFS